MITNNKYALISVFNKEGIIDFAKTLIKLNFTIISTGGTAKVLKENNIAVIPIEKITGNPEAFDGRMKTISFGIESGILFDRVNKNHINQAKKLNIKPIDIVVCNLYPFEKTVANLNSTDEQIIENIDVGGPTMIKAASKNFKNVLIIIDPKDYTNVSQLLMNNKINNDFRQQLAAKAFNHLSVYDSQVAKYLNKEVFPDEQTIPLRKIRNLRYGENPHQQAAFYIEPNSNSPLKNLIKISGRDLSLVNLTDINAGIESIRFYNEPCAVVIKHNNPCGIALGSSIAHALERAIDGDPESAFGGIIVVNKNVDLNTVKIVTNFKKEQHSNIDIFAAPSFDKNAIEILMKTRKSMGLYSFGKIINPKNEEKNIKFLLGGAIIQTFDNVNKNLNNWTTVTKNKPTEKQFELMRFGWKCISRIKSNSIIVIDKSLPMTRGIGSGQTSRIRSTRIALDQAKDYCKGAILISDSFFPFADSVKLAAKYGIAAIVQQGGSINDKQSIDEANKNDIVMVFTNHRAFWH